MSFMVRMDPQAAVKAGTVTLVLMGIQQQIPDVYWARAAGGFMQQPPAIRAALLVLGAFSLMAVCVAYEWRAAIWRRLTFTGVEGTRAHHSGCVVWLHGVGDTGAGYAWLRKQMSQVLPHVKWRLPTGGLVPMTVAKGAYLRGWFDVKLFPITPDEPDDTARREAAIAAVHQIVMDEVAKGIPPERIVLGGFSQGGALAMWAAATCPNQLAGVVLWSSHAVSSVALQSAVAAGSNCSTPHLFCPLLGLEHPYDARLGIVPHC